MKKFVFIPLFLLLLAKASLSQQIIVTGESPNYYLKVEEVFTDRVRITETKPGQLEQFVPESKVMIIQMTGVTIDTSSSNFETTASRTKYENQNTGKFEVLQVDEVVTGADTLIYFTDNFANSYDNGEKIQLVKLIEGEVVTVNGSLTVTPWDGNIGGIIGIIGIDTVRLSAGSSINASAGGFRGGLVPDEYYIASCRYGLSTAIKDTLYFLPTELGRSGNKGEGIITASWPFTKGTAFNINGGGAGNGLYAGGGGGSNYGVGGDGGQQSAACGLPYSAAGGWGGYNCQEFYLNPAVPNVIFGGGGGSGTRMNGSTASRGGNGGGIVIILTEALVGGAGTSILANGENAAHSQGAGGGGGGGGAILIDAAKYKGSNIGIYVRGGGGGNSTNPAPNSLGGGGSGSGGVFWHSGSVFPSTVIDTLASNAGSTGGGISYFSQIGVKGGNGARLKNLIVPLTGFLFNSIRGTDTICALQTPDTITASQPKGGNGIYSYQWEQSIDKSTWVNAVGTATLRYFVPAPLNQTTYFRRIVNSISAVNDEPINDISRSIEVFVYPAIANNNITGTDTICYHANASALTGSSASLTGGNNFYRFEWQYSSNEVTWSATGTEASFDPAELDNTTHYRRIVHSTAYCSDTTEAITITVLPTIQNNQFSNESISICENGSPGRLQIAEPAGGDGIYTFQWQYREFPGSWINIASSGDSVQYTIGNLTDTTAFRRTVFSGNDRACMNTSDSIMIIIRPLISNNYIEGSSVKYTCYNTGIQISGSNPQEGFGPGTYNFAWESSADNIQWNSLTGTETDYQSEPLTTSCFFRRTVYSSLCTDVSPSVEVRINPLPAGNVFNAFDTLCAGETLYVKFNVAGNGPFTVTVGAEGEQDKTAFNVSGPVDSVYFMPQATKPYYVTTIIDDSSCVADPALFVPVVPGMVYAVPVADAGIDSEICNNSFELQANKTNPGYHGVWSGSAVFSNDTLENSLVTIEDFDTYTFIWTENNWQCFDDDEVEITFHEQPEIPDAGEDQALNFVYVTQLEGSLPSAGIGLWTVSSGKGIFSDPNAASTEISDLSDITIVRWTVTNGNCPAVTDSLLIMVNPLHITKGFTPNGDNRNDFFDLGAEHAERIKLKVYNPVGNLVYESDNYNSSEAERWFGENMNGVKLPEGTYFYIATIRIAGKQEEVQFKSFVEILRD